ncbi:MAG: hypothetical protein IJL83_02420 [Clostridia bacterium]|nr:hypothetical protein [Clostridia bacterium]
MELWRWLHIMLRQNRTDINNMITGDQNDLSNKENVIAGIVGAFLFSLAGGLAWFLFYLAGIIAAVSGLIGVVLAIKGYKLFAKKESIKGIIIASIIAFAVLVLAWYLCLGKDVYDAYQAWYKEGEIDFTLSFSESIKAVPTFLKEPEIAAAYIKDLLLGLGFALIGSIGTIITSVKGVKAKQALMNAESRNTNPQGEASDEPETSTPIRSALTDEKVREYLKENVFGHEVIFRKVARSREELVIDGAVYAEYALVSKVQFPYEMYAKLDGHRYEAGYGVGRGNYISVDGVVIAKKFRW